MTYFLITFDVEVLKNIWCFKFSLERCVDNMLSKNKVIEENEIENVECSNKKKKNIY